MPSIFKKKEQTLLSDKSKEDQVNQIMKQMYKEFGIDEKKPTSNKILSDVEVEEQLKILENKIDLRNGKNLLQKKLDEVTQQFSYSDIEDEMKKLNEEVEAENKIKMKME